MSWSCDMDCFERYFHDSLDMSGPFKSTDKRWYADLDVALEPALEPLRKFRWSDGLLWSTRWQTSTGILLLKPFGRLVNWILQGVQRAPA